MTEEKITTTDTSDETDIRSSHTFLVEGAEADLFFCKCGNIIENSKSKGEEVTIKIAEGGEFDISDVDELSTRASNIVCDKCDADYSKKEEYAIIVPIGKSFMERYSYAETSDRITLYKLLYKGVLDADKKGVSINKVESHMALDKDSKKIFFKDFQDVEEREFTLDQVFTNVKRFYSNNEVDTSDGLFHVHSFLNRLANFVSDSKNMNVVQELMSQMIGKAGIDILTKINSIFFAIICYPNISTIALTKGTLFLYDMLNNCNLPKPSVLADDGATSPISIFNFLVNIKNQEISERLDSYDKDKVGYVFKSKSGGEHNISYEAERFDSDSESGKVKSDKGGVFVRDDVSHKSVSNYIFKKIKRFSDYETLIRYTKFISYQNLVNLVMKYDVDFLVGILDTVEFRDGVNMERLKQFINLAVSFLIRYKRISQNKDYDSGDLKFLRKKFQKSPLNFEQRTDEEKKEIDDLGALNYSLLKYFDLVQYDDCNRMIAALNWDPNKEFYKIKDMSELEKYHDQLVEHFNVIQDDKKNKEFADFTAKYKFLEEYDGDLKLKVIGSPEMLLSYAQSMRNCAGSYINRVASGQYVLFIVEDLSTERKKEEPQFYMFGIILNKHNLEFDQVKAACNKQGPDRFKRQIMKYLEDKDISYKELADLKIGGKEEARAFRFDLLRDAEPLE